MCTFCERLQRFFGYAENFPDGERQPWKGGRYRAFGS
jgi:hypothetical protein